MVKGQTNGQVKACSLKARMILNLCLAACFTACQGCAYLGPKYLQPSEADEGMGPPPEGYIADGRLAEDLVGCLQSLKH